MAGNLVLGALRHVWSILSASKCPMALMGGLALATWQRVRATRDVDILINLAKTDLHSLLGTLASDGIKPKRQPPIFTLGDLRMVELEYQAQGVFVPIQIDLLLADSAYHAAALARRVTTRLPDLDIDVSVLTCEDLVLHKLLAGRIVDRADVIALLQLNRATLDLAYLKKWIKDLNLDRDFTEVWKQAFPNENLP